MFAISKRFPDVIPTRENPVTKLSPCDWLFFNRIWQFVWIGGKNASEKRNNFQVKYFYSAAVERLWNRA